MINSVISLQPWNTPVPIVVTDGGMLSFVIPVQPWNAYLPILVTEEGILSSFIPVRPQNAYSPIVVAEEGTVGFVIPVRSLNSIPIVVAHASILNPFVPPPVKELSTALATADSTPSFTVCASTTAADVAGRR